MHNALMGGTLEELVSVPRPDAREKVLQGDRGVSLAVLRVPSAVPQTVSTPPETSTIKTLKEFAALARENFTALQRDYTRGVTREDIDAAIPKARFDNPSGALLLKVLKQNFDSIASLTGAKDEISLLDIRALIRPTAGQRETVLGLASIIEALKPEVEQLIAGNPQLVNGARFSSSAIRQGDSPDCYFLAVLGSMAEGSAAQQSTLKQMIAPLADGRYRVTFPGDTDNPVTVSAPTAAERALYNGGSTNGSWAGVLEKAYASYERSGISRLLARDKPDQEALPTSGGNSQDVIRLLTGQSADRFYIETPLLGLRRERSEALHQLLKTVVAEQKLPATAGISYNEEGRTKMGLITAHEYSIVGYDPERRRVMMRNPIAGMEPTNRSGKALDGKLDGVFSLSIDQFQYQVSVVTFQKAAR